MVLKDAKSWDSLDVGSPYPERTLDTFGFLEGAHSAARQAIVWCSKLQKPWDRLDVGHLPPASCCRPAMQRLFRAATDAPTNMHCKSISGQYCRASVQKPIVDSVQNCPKCPTSQLWAFKIGTSGDMKSILHSQNSPKMWELAFESRMLYHSVKFWMIFNV